MTSDVAHKIQHRKSVRHKLLATRDGENETHHKTLVQERVEWNPVVPKHSLMSKTSLKATNHDNVDILFNFTTLRVPVIHLKPGCKVE